MAAQTATQTCSLAFAQQLALSNSKKYKKIYNQLILERMKYTDSLESIQAKRKNMASFRWSPILNFKFPEQPKMSQEFEFMVKPLEIQTKINSLQYELGDLKYKTLETVNNVYAEVYLLQEKIDFTQKQLDTAQKTLERNQLRLAQGEAKQKDVDQMQKNVETITSSLSQLKRNFESAKEKLTDNMGLDISAGYRFTNPFQAVDFSRSTLDELVEYTVQHDLEYYQKKLETASALTNLKTYEAFMKQKYGTKLAAIQSYIDEAKAGKEIDYDAYKAEYDKMLKEIDKPWSYKATILFFTFTMEWLKGEIDGTRYMEDEPYALYTASMEYANALKDQETAEKDLRKEVKSSFESLITARNSYETAKKNLEETKQEVQRMQLQNQQGMATYDETQQAQQDYEEEQLNVMELLQSYYQLINGFDRLTCGGITKLLSGEAISTEVLDGVDSRVDKAYYTITTKIEDQVFIFRVVIPEDYEPEVTAYELWYDGMQIGKRTNVEDALQHLTLLYKDQNKMTVRFYNEDTYVDECEIDPSIPTDILPLKVIQKAEEKQEKEIGTYEIATNTETGITQLTFSFSDEDVVYYQLQQENGKQLGTQEYIPVSDKFSYLSILSKEMDKIIIQLYDKNKQLLKQGYFLPTEKKIVEKQ